MRRKWLEQSRRAALNAVLAGLIALAPVLALGSPAFATDATDAAAANSALAVSKSISSQNLRSLLDGATQVSVGVSDLREMQSHVRNLVEQVKKCTVGVQVGPAWGSGVIISKDGYVLTAAHVADAGRSRRLTDVEEGSEEGGVAHFKLADGREVKGKRLGLFRTQDAGLMKITDPGEYPFAPLAKDVNLNQWCIALGHPGGYQADRGLVLRLGRVLHVDDKAITTDCTLVGGDSGGPLFDMNGRIIGINSRISENLTANMHVPVSTYNDGGNWERMVKGDVWGRLPGQEPAWLGVRGEKDSKGARIAAVTPGSPAEKEGVRPGDVILALDGKPIGDFPALARFIEECRPNESVKVELRRGNQNLEFHVRLSKQP